MRSFSVRPARLILVPSALQSHALLPFHFIQHFVPPLRFFSPCPRPSGKVPGFSAKTVHFPPWPTGVPAPQASLAALAVSPPGESAGFSGENGSLSPVADRGTGSTDPSGRTCSLSLPGKCRVFRRKWFTFPRGRQGCRLHRPLWPHLQSLPPGKVPGISAKTVHFPPWPDGAPAPQASLAPLGISTPGESAGNFGENGSLSPRGRQGHRLHMPLSPHLPFPPPGKVPGISAKTVHFPPRHETSGEVQQSLLWKVPSIQAL